MNEIILRNLFLQACIFVLLNQNIHAMKTLLSVFLVLGIASISTKANDSTLLKCNAKFSYSVTDTSLDPKYVMVQFNDQSIGDVISWSWSVNDSTFSHQQNPSYSFYINRWLKCKSTKCLSFYNVCLTTITRDSCVSTYCETIIPEDLPSPPCQVSFNYYNIPSDSIAVPAMSPVNYYAYVKFIGISPNNVVKWHWEFGDSTSSDEQNPLHAFYVNPIWNVIDCMKKSTNCFSGYYVCLTITTADSCSTSYCSYVYPSINPVPSCSAYFSYDVLESNPPQYKFYNESVWDSGTVMWSFGDGTFSYDENPTHVFSIDSAPPPIDSIILYDRMYPFMATYKSVYTVCLTIYSASGCVNTYCQDIFVQPTDNNLCNNFIKLTTTSILGSDYCNGSAKAELIDQSGNPVGVKQYIWSTGSTSSEITNLCSNVAYYVSLTNDEGCVTVGSFSVSDYTSPWYIQYQYNSLYYTFQYLNYIPGYVYEWNFSDSSVETGDYIPYKSILGSNSNWVELVVKDQSGNEVNRQKIYLNQPQANIKNPLVDNHLKLFPVPPTNELNIRLEKPVNSNCEITVSDVLGRIQLKQVFTESNNLSVNIGQLPKGTYICRLKAGTYLLTAKFIK
jgi:hypothetical protein